MGLDMYVFAARKTKLDENKIYKHSELGDVIAIPDDEKDDPKIAQIIHLAKPIKVITEYLDFQKIKETYHFENDPDVKIYGNGFSQFSDTASKYTVKIGSDRIDAEFTKTEVGICYVVDIEEVAYWRKAYDIQDWFHAELNCPVENCGYYRITTEQANEYNKKFGAIEYADWIDLSEYDDVEYFYHEWY